MTPWYEWVISHLPGVMVAVFYGSKLTAANDELSPPPTEYA